MYELQSILKTEWFNYELTEYIHTECGLCMNYRVYFKFWLMYIYRVYWLKYVNIVKPTQKKKLIFEKID